MTEHVTNVEVAASAAPQQVKAQVRMMLALVAGLVLGRLVDAHILPATLNNQPVIEAIVGIVVYGAASGWTYVRVRLQHSRLWSFALNPRVPNDIVRPKPGDATGPVP